MITFLLALLLNYFLLRSPGNMELFFMFYKLLLLIIFTLS